MLNMNSPVVQNLIQPQSGFNPYTNNGYIPQQQQQNYYGYNPYFVNQQNAKDDLDNWEFTYDPMPKNIHSSQRNPNNLINPVNNGFNSQVFNGYMNPILMKNQLEAQKLQQREEAIQQGKIWRTLLQNELKYDENFDIDSAVHYIESLYYTEPIMNDIPIKDKMIIEKNEYFGRLEATLDYYRQNNIPIVDNLHAARTNFCNYYNHINSVIGDPNNCDIVDYFTRVYPELKYEQLSWEAERFNKNLKNKYDSNNFNKLIDATTKDRPDSYYYKLMESFADNGVKLTNGDGLVMTPDEMEIKLPDRLLKNRQDKYYEQRRKFYESIFNKKE